MSKAGGPRWCAGKGVLETSGILGERLCFSVFTENRTKKDVSVMQFAIR